MITIYAAPQDKELLNNIVNMLRSYGQKYIVYHSDSFLNSIWVKGNRTGLLDTLYDYVEQTHNTYGEGKL